LRAADAETANGVYIHDRRSGERAEIVSVESKPLGRHAADELDGMALSAGLDADLTLVTGCQPAELVKPELYRRLVSDLRANGARIAADLTGPLLAATLDGGVTLLRVSEEELIRDGFAAGESTRDLLGVAVSLKRAGAGRVLISRASAPAIFIEGYDPSAQFEFAGPVFEALDHTGTGDSMFAAIGVGLSRGMDMLDAVRLGVAAGALNATRRGLGTGTRQEIERLASHVTIRPLSVRTDTLSA
jgi:1-phosphofructokinase